MRSPNSKGLSIRLKVKRFGTCWTRVNHLILKYVHLSLNHAWKVSSIVFLILIFAGYNQRAIMNGRWIILRWNATCCSNSMEQIVPPLLSSRDIPYPGFILVLPGLACGGLYLVPNLQCPATVMSSGKRERLLSHSHAVRFARWRCRFDERSKICFRVERLELMTETGAIGE